jgi:hypothetical protein
VDNFMIIRSELFIDKSDWLPGPWVDEPDIVFWMDEGSRLPCLILRNPETGSLCGYVGVPPGHPAWGMHYDDLPQVEVHGGLTYGGIWSELNDRARRIGMPPEEGSFADHWTLNFAGHWALGYDCAHYGDKFGFKPPPTRAPSKLGASTTTLGNGEYRDAAYCMNQCERLASQLTGTDP